MICIESDSRLKADVLSCRAVHKIDKHKALEKYVNIGCSKNTQPGEALAANILEFHTSYRSLKDTHKEDIGHTTFC